MWQTVKSEQREAADVTKELYVTKECLRVMVDPPFNQYFAYDEKSRAEPKVTGRKIESWHMVEYAALERERERSRKLIEMLDILSSECRSHIKMLAEKKVHVGVSWVNKAEALIVDYKASRDE